MRRTTSFIILLIFAYTHIAVQAKQTSLYNPTQYAFIADAALPSIAVVDIHASKQIDLLRLPVAAKVFASSTDQPYLAFSDRDNWAFYLYDLNTRQIEKVTTPAAVYDIRFIPNTQNIAVVLEEQVGMYNRRSKELTVLDRRFQHLYTRFETVFSIFSQTFWVMQENTPLIHRYSFTDKDPQWQSIDLGYEHGLGSGAPSFEDEIIAINSYYPDKSFIYNLSTESVISTPPLYDSRKLDKRLVKPYIDGATKHVIFADVGGNILVYDRWSDTPDTPIRNNVGYPITIVKTGWLDQYLIAGGVEKIGIFSLQNLEPITSFDFPEDHDVWDVWVTGDSKMALATTSLSANVFRYDLQNQQRLPDIKLNGIVQAKIIRMGSSNDACY